MITTNPRRRITEWQADRILRRQAREFIGEIHLLDHEDAGLHVHPAIRDISLGKDLPSFRNWLPCLVNDDNGIVDTWGFPKLRQDATTTAMSMYDLYVWLRTREKWWEQ